MPLSQTNQTQKHSVKIKYILTTHIRPILLLTHKEHCYLRINHICTVFYQLLSLMFHDFIKANLNTYHLE